ncbi:MAG: GNAT family N-acetyltransferase [bacterium]|nr:GNAT family N-acetyltransferase [bacterium]
MNIKFKTAKPTSKEVTLLSDELHNELEQFYGKGVIESFYEENKEMLVFFVAYNERDSAVACGALKHFDETTAEIKRMYVKKDSRGLGISKSILTKLEQHAKELHYQRLILETGLKQPEAMNLYRTFGYTPIKCYGSHADDPDSRCFEKIIN